MEGVSRQTSNPFRYIYDLHDENAWTLAECCINKTALSPLEKLRKNETNHTWGKDKRMKTSTAKTVADNLTPSLQPH